MRYRSKNKIESKLRRAYKRAECQARYRNQDWSVSWEYWLDCWSFNDNYLNKGRSNDSLVFCRLDHKLPWTDQNTTVRVRKDHLIATIELQQPWQHRSNLKNQQPNGEHNEHRILQRTS